MFKTVKLAAVLFVKRIPYILIVALCVYAIVYLAQLSFYRYAPPAVFFRVSSASIDTAQVNQPLNFTFCRYARSTFVSAPTTRSYFRLEGSNRYGAGEYTFTATYERGDSCQVIKIPVERHPSQSGVYYAETTVRYPVRFDNYVFHKEYTYQTETFRLSDTVKGLQQQIIELQTEIETLKAILRSRGVVVPETQSASPPPAVPVENTTSSAPPNQPVVATAPPDPEQTPPNPQSVGLVTQLVTGTLNTLRNATNGLLPNGIL